MKFLPATGLIVMITLASACARLEEVGKAPSFSPSRTGDEYFAISQPSQGAGQVDREPLQMASLWSRDRASLLGDRRAGSAGDILTIVIEIDDRAEMSNQSERSRNSSQSIAIPQFFGVPQELNQVLPDGASLDNAAETNSASGFAGDGATRRNEKLELRIAATITAVMSNGVLQIAGTQEVRVNFELRELRVTGFVRPSDISRRNEITYDKIASARISYGGRGQISDVQQPRYGQQVADIVLPF